MANLLDRLLFISGTISGSASMLFDNHLMPFSIQKSWLCQVKYNSKNHNRCCDNFAFGNLSLNQESLDCQMIICLNQYFISDPC